MSTSARPKPGAGGAASRAYMGGMTVPPSERLRARLSEAFPAHAAKLGWTEAALKAAAAEAGLGEGEVQLAAPQGVRDMADAFAARADEAMLAALAKLDLPTMRIRDKVRAAVRARLEAQAPYKDAARAMTRWHVRPSRAQGAGALLWRTADKIWRALGDQATDGNYYSKRAILAGVLASTYARWFADDDPESAKTWAFLDARIENVMQFEKMKAQTRPLAALGETAMRAAARFRYGANA